MQIWLRQPHGRGPRRRSRSQALGAFTALALTAALALPASALAKDFTIRLHIANHAPVVGKRWPVELTVMKGARKLNGSVRYQWLFDNAVVKTQPLHGGYRFKHGVYRDQLVFPSQSVGEPLTLRFLVRTRYGTEHVDWTLRTRKGR
jgi:hypothetical protein